MCLSHCLPVLPFHPLCYKQYWVMTGRVEILKTMKNCPKREMLLVFMGVSCCLENADLLILVIFLISHFENMTKYVKKIFAKQISKMKSFLNSSPFKFLKNLYSA